MRPAEVLDAQIDLIDRLDDPKFRYLIQVMTANSNRITPSSQGTDYKRKVDEQGEAPPMLQRHVKAAYAYRVSMDMCLMVEHAAAMLDGTDQFDPSLAPTGCGIVCFDRGLRLRDIRGKTMLVHWLVWGPGRFKFANTTGPFPGTVLWMFNDMWRQPDEVQEYFRQQYLGEGGDRKDAAAWARYQRMSGRWATVGFQTAFPEQRVGPALWQPDSDLARQALEEGFEAQPGTNALRFVMALWMLLGQTVTKVDDEIPDRAARRRAGRANIPPKVTVIRLRREENPNRQPGESLVEWQHRWIVRGHWRWQACGPGRSERRRIWINPFVKGPEDAPLIQTEKVYDLNR